MNYRILHIIIICYVSTLCHAKTLDICPDCTISTIKDGIAIAEKGDILSVKKGVYFEFGIVVDKALSIIGESGAVIDGDDQGEILTIVANDVTIRGLTFQNVGTSYIEDRSAIRVRKSKEFVISENILLNTFFGIYLEHSSDGSITDNKIIGEAEEEMSSGNAIHAWYCKRVFISGNHVSHHRDGIYFEFVDDSIIENNVSTANLRYGLHFMFSNNDNYSGNLFQNNGAGVAVMFSKKINMWDNRFEYNWGKSSYGLLLKEIYDAEIYDNIFLENTIGIYVEGSTRINYKSNDFKQNGWAIKISGGCLDNVVSNNNFISNTFDLSLKTAQNNNRFESNYWSQYTGYDLDKNGIGDVPYRPVKLFNFIVDQTPEAMILMRSLFVDLINFSEKVSPVFTPRNVLDEQPLMQQIKRTTR